MPLCLVMLPLVAVALRRRGLARLQARLEAELPASVRTGDARRDAAAREEALRLAWVVDLAARRGIWRANCLQSSLVLWWLLQRRGMPGELRIGVRRRPGIPSGSEGLDFHAWVELDGLALNEAPDVRARFATFERAIVPDRAAWR